MSSPPPTSRASASRSAGPSAKPGQLRRPDRGEQTDNGGDRQQDDLAGQLTDLGPRLASLLPPALQQQLPALLSGLPDQIPLTWTPKTTTTIWSDQTAGARLRELPGTHFLPLQYPEVLLEELRRLLPAS